MKLRRPVVEEAPRDPPRREKTTKKSKKKKKRGKVSKRESQKWVGGGLSRSAESLSREVALTTKMSKEEFYQLFTVYDDIIVRRVYHEILLPHTRFARRYLASQINSILSLTDHNRTIVRRVVSAENEERFSALSATAKKKWSPSIKPKHSFSLLSALSVLRKLEEGSRVAIEELEGVGVARHVYEYAIVEFLEITRDYPRLVLRNALARVRGDSYLLMKTDEDMQKIERAVGGCRDTLWWAVVQTRLEYSDVTKIIDRVTSGYSRLLMKMAHRIKGKTSLEENFSAGADGLKLAAVNYDLQAGASFSTYAPWWIQNNIKANQKRTSVVSIPYSTWYALSQVEKEIAKTGTHKGKFTDSYVENLRRRAAAQHTVSLDVPVEEAARDEHAVTTIESLRLSTVDADYGDVVSDVIPDEELENAYERFTHTDTLRKGLKVLDETSLFAVVTWMLNSGIDTNLIARIFADKLLGEEEIEEEKTKQEKARTAKGTSSVRG